MLRKALVNMDSVMIDLVRIEPLKEYENFSSDLVVVRDPMCGA